MQTIYFFEDNVCNDQCSFHLKYRIYNRKNEMGRFNRFYRIHVCENVNKNDLPTDIAVMIILSSVQKKKVLHLTRRIYVRLCIR